MTAPYEGLTPREIEVLLLLEEGATTFEIARRLGITPSATKEHLDSIYAKAGITNQANRDLTQLGLTTKQQQVARLLLAGDTNPAIAQKLYLTRDSVRHHIRGLYRQLGVGNRYEAIALLNRSDTPRR